MVRNYTKLQIYHLGYDLVLKVYHAISLLPKEEIRNISLQLRRAAVSIPLNIAEGTSRKSRKEFRNFIIYAFGSGKELEVLLNLCKDLKLLSEEEYIAVYKPLQTFMAKVTLFIRDLERKIPEGKLSFIKKLDRERLVHDIRKTMKK